MPSPAERLDDEGFSLIEVVIAMALVLSVMMSLTGFFVRSMIATSTQNQRNIAVELGDQGLEQVRAASVGSLLSGRSTTEVAAQWASPGRVDLSQTNADSDATAVVGATPLVALSRQQIVDNVPYTVKTFIGYCFRALAADATSAACTKAKTVATDVEMDRAAVAVSWTPGRGQTCAVAGGLCEYVVTTLLDPSTDAVFNTGN